MNNGLEEFLWKYEIPPLFSDDKSVGTAYASSFCRFIHKENPALHLLNSSNYEIGG